MTFLIFAGGAGTRLWPLSRVASPKQFEPFFEGKSTLQLAVDRVRGFGLENIYVSTNEAYVGLVQEQISDLDSSHIFSEPAKRDLTAAVGLSLVRLKEQGAVGAVGMLWADHLIERPEVFRNVLSQAEELIHENPDRLIFIGERPRFPNENLGWIHVGEERETGVREFKEWKYRPDLETCRTMFQSGEWLWNPGYFVYDIDFMIGLYEKHQPKVFKALREMIGDEESIAREYPNLPAIHFDHAIAEHVGADQAVVLSADMGWSDPGTLYAMKEALASSANDTVAVGSVVHHESSDCFIYNRVGDQVVTTVGLEGIVVVNTGDAILVCHKDHVPKIKELLELMKEKGHGHLL